MPHLIAKNTEAHTWREREGERGEGEREKQTETERYRETQRQIISKPRSRRWRLDFRP